ncbi:hypothetical protein HID58_087308, partial [Brassica napus]
RGLGLVALDELNLIVVLTKGSLLGSSFLRRHDLQSPLVLCERLLTFGPRHLFTINEKKRSKLTPDAATLQCFSAHKKRDLTTLDGKLQHLLNHKRGSLISYSNHYPHYSCHPPVVHQIVEKPGRYMKANFSPPRGCKWYFCSPPFRGDLINLEIWDPIYETRDPDNNVVGKMILHPPTCNFFHSYQRKRAHRKKSIYLRGRWSNAGRCAAQVLNLREPEESINSEGPAPDLCFFDVTLPPIEEESQARFGLDLILEI